ATGISMEAFGINMPNAPLRAALGERVMKLKPVTFIEAALQDFEAGDFSVAARLDNGDTITAKLLAGADGARSATRALAGIKVWEREYGQQAITCLIDHSKLHGNVSTEFHR